MNDYFYRILQAVFSLFCHCRLLDKKNIPDQGPAIYVSNHLGSYGPVAVLTAFPVRLYPWVDYQLTDGKLCPAHLCKDFIEPELHFGPPLSHVLAWLVSRACLPLMRFIRAIPVCQKGLRLGTTWKRSLELLKQNRSLIVFPENDQVSADMVVNEFDDGFVGIASIYYEITDRVLTFIPVAVNKIRGAIRIGQPIPYNPKNNFPSERKRIAAALHSRIMEMYLSLRQI